MILELRRTLDTERLMLHTPRCPYVCMATNKDGPCNLFALCVYTSPCLLDIAEYIANHDYYGLDWPTKQERSRS